MWASSLKQRMISEALRKMHQDTWRYLILTSPYPQTRFLRAPSASTKARGSAADPGNGS